jgi:hypothetical protein
VCRSCLITCASMQLNEVTLYAQVVICLPCTTAKTQVRQQLKNDVSLNRWTNLLLGDRGMQASDCVRLSLASCSASALKEELREVINEVIRRLEASECAGPAYSTSGSTSPPDRQTRFYTIMTHCRSPPLTLVLWIWFVCFSSWQPCLPSP